MPAHFKTTMQETKTPKDKQEPWPELPGLKEFFRTCTLPKEKTRLSKCEIVVDSEKFVKAHLETCEANDGNPTYHPYLDRLIRFREMIK